MYGIGRDTGVRDAIGVTVAIVTAILLLGVAELVPMPSAASIEPSAVIEVWADAAPAAAVEAPAPEPAAVAAEAPPAGRI